METTTQEGATMTDSEFANLMATLATAGVQPERIAAMKATRAAGKDRA